MWFYYSEKNRKKREEAERARKVKRKQDDFELDESEYATDNHLYIIYFFGRIFYRYLIYFKMTLLLFFILGWYFPIFHLLILWRYFVYTCEWIVLDEEINFDFHDEAVEILLLTRQGGYLGFENIHICMIYDELGYAYWDVDTFHDLRSDRYYYYNLMYDWAGYIDNYQKINKEKFINIKKENKWIKLYVKEKVNIKNDKDNIKNFSKINKIIYKRRHLLRLNRLKNKFIFSLRKNKVYFLKNYKDFISLNRVRGLAKWRFLDLSLKNYETFGAVHKINKNYLNEDKKDDYYK
jgi:hypothetical protein